MKKATTIIIEIDKLERELYTNYSPKAIKEAIEKCEENHKIEPNLCDLISVIYEGVTSYVTLEEDIYE